MDIRIDMDEFIRTHQRHLRQGCATLCETDNATGWFVVRPYTGDVRAKKGFLIGKRWLNGKRQFARDKRDWYLRPESLVNIQQINVEAIDREAEKSGMIGYEYPRKAEP